MSSLKLTQTALKFLSGFQSLSPDTFLAVLSPTAIHEFAPASCSPPAPKTPTALANHITTLKQVLASFPVHPKEIFENEEKRQVTIWATSLAVFRDDVKDAGLSDEEWSYRGEYIFILTMDERQEKIMRVLEFVDSKGTNRLRGLMARARANLEMKT